MNRILSFLKSHDCTLAAFVSRSGITVASYVTDREGRVSVRRETIAATISAARDWLGY